MSGDNAISIADDSQDGKILVGISTGKGTLSLSKTADLSGLAFTSGDGVDDYSQAFIGTLSEINAALDGLVFKPSVGFVGTAYISVTVNDLGSGGTGTPLTDAKSVEHSGDSRRRLCEPSLGEYRSRC